MSVIRVITLTIRKRMPSSAKFICNNRKVWSDGRQMKSTMMQCTHGIWGCEAVESLVVAGELIVNNEIECKALERQDQWKGRAFWSFFDFWAHNKTPLLLMLWRWSQIWTVIRHANFSVLLTRFLIFWVGFPFPFLFWLHSLWTASNRTLLRKPLWGLVEVDFISPETRWVWWIFAKWITASWFVFTSMNL